SRPRRSVALSRLGRGAARRGEPRRHRAARCRGGPALRRQAADHRFGQPPRGSGFRAAFVPRRARPAARAPKRGSAARGAAPAAAIHRSHDPFAKASTMSGIELRTYDGDGSDLATLTNRAWRATVAGKAMFPLWSREYFQWRLLDERGGGRDFLVAAYRG